jgi:hypothetical protein
MKEMGYEEGEEGGEGEEEEEAEEGDAYRDGAPQAGPGRPAEPTPRPVPTGGGASGKRAQVQPAAAAAGSGGAARALGVASQPRRAFVPDPYKGEPPDFEPPPRRMCFEEEEEGAGRRVQIAILATVVLLLTGCVVRAPHRTCSASPHRHHAPTPSGAAGGRVTRVRLFEMTHAALPPQGGVFFDGGRPPSFRSCRIFIYCMCALVLVCACAFALHASERCVLVTG